jgi:ectoine hydroxylase-related dioxygenase (phytanoyl-CoA dioxygenase family)
LPDAQINEIRREIRDLAEQDRLSGKLITQGGRWRLRLVGRSDAFQALAAHDLVWNVGETMLGKGFVMGGLSVHALEPGAPPQGVHVDYPYSAMAEPFPEPPLQMQAIWALDPFGEDNGATRVLAHSQKTRRLPDRAAFHSASTPVHCPAGSLILSHGGLWHDTSTNHSNTVRMAILGNYTPFWVRSMESLPDRVRTMPAPKDARIRQLLGLSFRDTMTRQGAWKRARPDDPAPPY